MINFNHFIDSRGEIHYTCAASMKGAGSTWCSASCPWTLEGGDQTAEPAISGQLTLPPAPQAAHCGGVA